MGNIVLYNVSNLQLPFDRDVRQLHGLGRTIKYFVNVERC